MNPPCLATMSPLKMPKRNFAFCVNSSTIIAWWRGVEGLGDASMKITAMMMCACLVLAVTACGKEGAEPQKQAASAASPEADPIKRGIMAMDAIYASEGAFQEHGMAAIDLIVHELQAALAMWPEAGNGEGVDACRMALKLQTAYMLNVQGKLGATTDSQTSDFRQACRNAISYFPDDARMHQVWDKLSRVQ